MKPVFQSFPAQIHVLIWGEEKVHIPSQRKEDYSLAQTKSCSSTLQSGFRPISSFQYNLSLDILFFFNQNQELYSCWDKNN